MAKEIEGRVVTQMIIEKDGIKIANPGSISIPKDNSKSYLIIEEGEMKLMTL